ncbi:M20/M25/M40 family metallo-hydrolase [Streptomyces sp. NPDC089799]|uniref:M20 metallopeptidase family protein n=1 Tax=Streptomyces sp. NPDC089799 TaxID=3155066 RepID=UPI00342B7FA6
MSENHGSGSDPGRRVVLGAAAGIATSLAVGGTAHASGHGAGRARIDQAAVEAAAARLDADLIAVRRDLYDNPQTAGNEKHVAGVIAARLGAAGLVVEKDVAGYGVVAVLRGALPGRTVAYRADVDAVPGNGVQTDPPPADPVHACGHDLHATIGIGVAEVLAGLRHRLAGTVVFFFQPAEEALTGAAAMIGAGVLDRYRPREIHALHCGPFPVGTFAVTPGVGLPGQDAATVTFGGPDHVATAAAFGAAYEALGTVPFPKDNADLERLVDQVRTPNGPLAEFLVTRALPMDAAEGRSALRAVYRCWPEDRWSEVRERIRSLARTFPDATVTFRNDQPFPALVCPEDDARALARHLRHRLGPRSVTTLHAAFPFNGEDYSLFLKKIPGTYSFLGVRTPGAPIDTAFPHYPAFSPDERAIGVGVRGMAGWLAERTAHRG